MRLVTWLVVSGLVLPPFCLPHSSQDAVHWAPAEAVDRMDANFLAFRGQHDQWLRTRQYCLRWCRADLEVPDVFPDLARGSQARAHAESLPPYLAQFPNRLHNQTKLLHVQCCQICTQDCIAQVTSAHPNNYPISIPVAGQSALTQ